VTLTVTGSVRRALAASAATAALLTLAGCGGDDSADKAAEKPAASSSGTASEPATTESATTGEAMSGEEFAGLLRAALDKATTAHLTMNLGGLGTGEGDVDYATKPPNMAMVMTVQSLGGDVEIRMVDGTFYMKSATFGDQWVSVSLDDPNSPLGNLGSQLDPTAQFAAFADAVTAATNDGPEDVDGESLDHYTATIDTEKLVQQLPESVAGQSGLPDTLQQEWWFDDEGLIRKFSSDFGVAGRIELSMSDWGSEVDIEAPPSDQVTTMPGSGTGGA
jgi:hypothetical protein